MPNIKVSRFLTADVIWDTLEQKAELVARLVDAEMAGSEGPTSEGPLPVVTTMRHAFRNDSNDPNQLAVQKGETVTLAATADTSALWLSRYCVIHFDRLRVLFDSKSPCQDPMSIAALQRDAQQSSAP